MSEDPDKYDLDETVTLSVTDTNALRAQLGLKPLQEFTNTENIVEPVLKAKVTAAEMRRRIEDSKAHFQRKKMLENSSILTEDDFELSTSEWVSKMRKTQQLNAKEQESKVLESKDEGSDHEIDRSTRVVHRLKDLELKGGDTMVLTLKDTSIINEKGDLTEDQPDLLENPEITAKEKKEKYKREKRAFMLGETLLDSHDDLMLDFVDMDPHKAKPAADEGKHILPHYDAWAEDMKLTAPSKENLSKGFKIGDLDCFEGNVPTNFPEPVNLMSSTGIQRDYMTPEETAQFIKKNFKRKKVNVPLKKQVPREEDDEPTNATKVPTCAKVVNKKRVGQLMSVSNEPVLELQDEEDDDYLYEQLAIRRKVPLESVNTLTAIEKLKEAEELLASGIQSVVGTVDIKKEELSSHSASKIEISGTTEFCRGVQTPLELMEEIQAKHTQYKTFKKGLLQEDTISHKEPINENQEFELPDIGNEDKEFIEKMVNEEVMDIGVASALNLLKQRKELEPIPYSKKRHSADNQPFQDTSGDIRLEYRDDYGRLMTPKEAFRYISWVFHGKGPGHNKREKILRKLEMERKAHTVTANIKNLPTLKALQKQQKTGSAYLVLSSVAENN